MNPTKEAIAWATGDIAADSDALSALQHDLLGALATQAGQYSYKDISNAEKIASRFFASNDWRWLTYERHLKETGARTIAEVADGIGQMSDAQVLVDRAKIAEIRSLAKALGLDTKGLRTKVALTDRILQNRGGLTQVQELIAKHRRALLAEMQAREYDELGFLLVQMIQFKPSNRARLADILDPDLTRFVDGVRYSAVCDSRTPEVCRFLDGKVFLLPAGAKAMHMTATPIEDLEALLPPNHCGCRSLICGVVVGEKIDPKAVITPEQIAHAKSLIDPKFLVRDTGADAIDYPRQQKEPGARSGL